MSHKNRIAVIGSNSFSGSDFVDLLLDDPANRILGISRSPEYPKFLLGYGGRDDTSNFEFKQLSLNEDLDAMMTALDQFEPGYVINFAAQGEVASSFAHPDHHYRTNALGIVRFAEALRQRDYLKRYVHISTPEVYGSCDGLIDEGAPLNPSSPYAASKASGDLFLQVLFKTYAFPVVLIRATNVYGSGQQLYRIMPRSFIYMKSRRPISLHGGGRAVKSYIHIRDVSNGELLTMKQGRDGEIYHFSPDQGRAIVDVVRAICDLVGVTFEDAVEITDDRIGQDKAYTINSAKARTELGWRPEISFDDGLRKVGEWIDRDWDEISAAELNYVHLK